jgi:hypothetical protein
VLITSRKLRHYFQEYSISVVTDYPLGDILQNQDATGRISKWVVKLGALNVDFKPRTTIKSQALVDFMAEWRENQLPTPTERLEHWVMYFDGSLKLEGAGAGVLLISPTYKLVTIPPTWPFACWGLDMIGPLPTALGGFNRFLVAIDKFTKWIEVKLVTCPKADKVIDFLDELVHRYGLPHRIITDLGSNFNNH